VKHYIAILSAVFLGGAMNLTAGGATNSSTIYDSDPKHLWNRLNEALFQRTASDGKHYGLDELDILYWQQSTHLLDEPSHQQALAALDEFIRVHGEKMIHDPFKHALLQRDLWQLFDWVATPWPDHHFATQREELENRLAVVIRRLALTTNEIAALPDNYALTKTTQTPDLPAGLFETNGDWVCLGPNGFQEIAPIHDHSFGGRSVFLAFVRFPQGRQAALNYLLQLRIFEHPWIYVTNTWPFDTTNSPREVLDINPHLPQFPTNTEWALARRMLTIDASGELRPTPIIESIQLRHYLGFFRADSAESTHRNGFPPQKFFEFDLDRRHGGVLREIAPDESDFLFVHFFSKGFDPFGSDVGRSSTEDSSRLKRGVLDDCRTCHSSSGIYSVNVATRQFQQQDTQPLRLLPVDAADVNAVINWKREQFAWGMLQGLWNQFR